MRRTSFLARLLALILGLALLTLAGPAEAYFHYAPQPQGPVGVGRPPIVKRLVFGDGERFAGAELWLDGVQVPVTWDESSGYLYYVPPEPLAPGTHQAQFVVRAESTDPDQYFEPLREDYQFTVAPGARGELPVPDAESRHALAYLNAYRAAAGLPAFSLDPALEAAASAHAGYVAADLSAAGHIEQPGPAAFTGVGPTDRSIYFGYYAGTSEVVHFESGAEKAVDGWLSAPYHRLALVDPNNRLLGYGHASAQRLVNVLNCGPSWPLAAGGATDSIDRTIVQWPYPGQTGVPTCWSGLENPDPLRLYPGVRGPVGYTVTLGFPEAEEPVRLSSATLTDASGTAVTSMLFSPAIDQYLTGTVAVIPYEPLQPNTVYTARFAGTVGDSTAFDETWSFTTGPATIEAGPGSKWSWSYQGDRVDVSFDGLRLREGVVAYLAGLPVRGLSVRSRTEFSFRVPAGFVGGPLTLVLVGPGGSEETLEMSGQLPAAPGSAGKAWTAVDPPLPFAGTAFRHRDGTVMIPAASLAGIGALAESVPEISRTHWTDHGHIGTITLGSAWAYVDGRPLRLGLPVQTLGGEAYVPVEFVSAFIGASGVLYDLTGHWAAGEVARLVDMGIVSGLGDGTFRPEARLTRAAFVKMLVLAAGLEPDPGATGGLADTTGHWVVGQGYMGPAVAAGVVQPAEHPGGLFEPNREITREEIAVMVVRAMGLEEQALALGGAGEGGAHVFGDSGLCLYAGHVAVAVEEGIVRGYTEPDGTRTFRPAGLATRAEAAVLIGRLLDWLAKGSN